MAAKTPRGGDIHDTIAKARRDRERRDHSFRSRALELFPPVCARCGRDFAGIKIHENEHARNEVANAYGEPSDADAPSSSTYQPFAGLDKLLKKPQ